MLVFLWMSKNNVGEQAPALFQTVTTTPIFPSPSPQPPQPQTLPTASDSEGHMRLEGVSQPLSDGSVRYTFTVVDVPNHSSHPLYETTLPANESIEIPYNSWAPGSKQLFLRLNTPQGSDYLVFKVDAQPYKDGSAYLKVVEYWVARESKWLIRDVTGWADPDLLIVQTKDENGGLGPSFWFVTSTRKFLQLAHR